MTAIENASVEQGRDAIVQNLFGVGSLNISAADIKKNKMSKDGVKLI
jgi:hypothetical protein